MIDLVYTVTARRARRGAIALEYALVLAFIAIIVLAALLNLSTGFADSMDKLGDTVGSAADVTFLF